MTRISTVLAMGLGAALAGCGDSSTSSSPARPINYQHPGDSTSQAAAGSGLQYSASTAGVADPTVDYMLALRTASLKLRGNLPSLDEQQRLKSAIDSGNPDDAQLVYESMVRGFIYNSPITFNRQMFHFWRNTLRMGGPTQLSGLFSNSLTDTRSVDLDTAPAFAAMLVANDRPMTDLFTAQDPICPTFDQATGNFTPGNCFNANGATAASPGNNVPAASQAGILTNPGFLAQYYSNFGFRRARLIQELFACTRYPAELSNNPQQIGPYLYSSPWPVDSVSNNTPGKIPTFIDSVRPRRQRGGGVQSGNNEYVDFKKDCQNCHSTLNHRAPMFAIFDLVGYRDMNNRIMATSTATGSPFAQVQEYLSECSPTAADPNENPGCKGAIAWRFEGKRFDFAGQGQMPDFPGFGKEMAADPQVAKCFMARAWNYAYSRDDIVNELAMVPDNVISDLATYFVQNNYNMKMALLKLYTSANFIRF